MKTIFIETKYRGKIDPSKIDVSKLPLRVGLIATVQFVDFLDEIRTFFEEKRKKVFIGKGKQKYNGQVLGCEASAAEAIASKVDAFLFIGDGSFHPLNVAVKTGKAVYTFNPLNNEFSEISRKDVETYLKRKKGALLKFLSSKNIGIIVSTKPGQYHDVNELIENNFNKKYPDKHFYVFIADTIDYAQLQNFNFIEAWVNTACPRIEEDIKIINIKEII